MCGDRVYACLIGRRKKSRLYALQRPDHAVCGESAAAGLRGNMCSYAWAKARVAPNLAVLGGCGGRGSWLLRRIQCILFYQKVAL